MDVRKRQKKKERTKHPDQIDRPGSGSREHGARRRAYTSTWQEHSTGSPANHGSSSLARPLTGLGRPSFPFLFGGTTTTTDRQLLLSWRQTDMHMQVRHD